MATKLLVGVTDHYVAPFDIEAGALGDDAQFIAFNSRDDAAFDADVLRRLDALLVFHARITERTLARLERCRIIVRYGVGVDNLDLDALARRAIPLCNTPDYGIEEIAATAAAHILNLWRRITQYDFDCRSHRDGWGRHILRPIVRLSAGTLGIVGTGRIGSALARCMQPYGCRILGYDKYRTLVPGEAPGYEPVERLEALLAAADAVSLHCVLTPETAGLVDEKFLAAMKPGAILVNTARGGLFKDLDVIEAALRSGQLGALGTDVLPSEPPGDHSLIRAWRAMEPWIRGRLVITPHTAFYSEASMRDMRFKAAETIRLYLDRGELRNRIV